LHVEVCESFQILITFDRNGLQDNCSYVAVEGAFPEEAENYLVLGKTLVAEIPQNGFQEEAKR